MTIDFMAGLLHEDEDEEMEFELFAHNFESLCRIQTMKAQ